MKINYKDFRHIIPVVTFDLSQDGIIVIILYTLVHGKISSAANISQHAAPSPRQPNNSSHILFPICINIRIRVNREKPHATNTICKEPPLSDHQ